MPLSEVARSRLADIVTLQPTKNAELADRWEMDSGKEVHAYLEDELSEYYYRDDNSLIRANQEAAELVDVEPGVETGEEGLILRVPELHRQILQVLPGPDERSISAVATLHALRDAYDIDPPIADVREGLKTLQRKGAVEVTYRMVPTFALAHPLEQIQVEAPSASA